MVVAFAGCGMAAMILASAGCEEQGSGGGGSSASGSGGALDNLSDNPTSLLGRSADRAVDVAGQASAAQDRVARQADAMTGASDARTIVAGGLSWTAPSGWSRVEPTSRMRAAELHVDGSVCAFFFFPRGGGEVQANIDRWAGQFRDPSTGRSPAPRVSRQTIDGKTVHLVELEGTFTDAMSGVTSPQERWAMRGAIIEGPQGNVMLKWTGTRETIESQSRAWRGMVEGMGGA